MLEPQPPEVLRTSLDSMRDRVIVTEYGLYVETRVLTAAKSVIIAADGSFHTASGRVAYVRDSFER
jgi:hypothetical protein